MRHRDEERPKRVLRALARYQRDQGIAPTLGELDETLAINSKCTISRDLGWLEDRGFLLRTPRIARSTRVTAEGAAALAAWYPDEFVAEEPELEESGEAAADIAWIDVMPARIAAGPPLDYADAFGHEDVEEWLPWPADAIGGRSQEHFAVEVRGESMRDAHILDGDLVILRRAETATPGDIVAVWLPEGVTLKRYRPEAGRIVFVAENPDVDDIVVPAIQDEDWEGEQPRIIGRFVSLVRGGAAVTRVA